MSTMHVSIDDRTSLTDLVDHLSSGDQVSLDRGDAPLALLLPVRQRPPYIGLYGNHPYETRLRPEPQAPDLAPEDFED